MDKIGKWRAYLNYIGGEYPFGPIQYIRNEEGKLHCVTGPAYISPTRCIWYQDGRRHGIDVDIWGTKIYYFENIHVPKQWIENFSSVTKEEILGNRNQELRYVGLKLYGFERLKEEGSFKTIDQTRDQELLEINLGGQMGVVRYVKVMNSTAEIDGSYKPYFLCVPPTIKTCKEAVAWTFGKNADDYNPSHET